MKKRAYQYGGTTTEFALFQILLLLFYLVEFVKCCQVFLELNFEGDYIQFSTSWKFVRLGVPNHLIRTRTFSRLVVQKFERQIEVKFLAASKVKNWTRAVKLVPRSLVDEAEGEIWSNPICARDRACQECDRQWKSAFLKYILKMAAVFRLVKQRIW